MAMKPAICVHCNYFNALIGRMFTHTSLLEKGLMLIKGRYIIIA